MWIVTVCMGDYRMPLRFKTLGSATQFIENVFESDEGEKINVVVSYKEEFKEIG